ncbi:hypothetical protein [Ideonella paludis]|uniref:hypothetical protein n=1 Tax=Ideonella paludis TaxID=1233411 RepID=UPI003631316B
MKILLHVGRHKTGTSSLQRYLNDNAKSLSELGYLYPNAGKRGIAHHELAESYSKTKNRLDPDGAKLKREKLLRELNLEIRPHHHTIILSSEAFQNAAVKLVQADFNKEFTTICMYIREQYDYMVSAYQQRIQAQLENCTLREFATTFKVTYSEALSEWVSFYDQENCIFRIFEKEELHNKNVIADFCRVNEIRYVSNVCASNEFDQNPSIGGRCLSLSG